MKRIVSLLLIVMLAISVLAACSENGDDTSKAESKATESKADTSAADESSVEESSVDPCPLEEKFWDKSVSLLLSDSKNQFRGEFWLDEIEEDSQLSVVFADRSALLKDKYGLTIDVHYVTDGTELVNELTQAINGGTPYNLVANAAYNLAPKTIDGYFWDLYELNETVNGGNGYLNLEADYWDQGIIADMSIANRMYFLTGDLCVTDDNATWAMLFNKDLINKHNLENPYDLVNSGDWTIDKMCEMAKEVVVMHGEKMSYNPDDGDVWGVLGQTYDGLMYMLGFGCAKIQKNSDDVPELCLTNQRNIDCFDKLYNMFVDQSFCGIADFFGAWNSGVYGQETKMFTNGNALFMSQNINALFGDAFTESDVEYGIIPMPKVDDLQEDYCASGNVYSVTVVAVPVCCPTEDLDVTVFTLEALAYYGKEMVTPAYYSLVLKGQKTKDEESEKNLDLIFKSRKYDLSDAYNFGDDMIQFYNHVFGNKTSNKYVSQCETYSGSYQKAIEKFVEAFQQ